MDDAHGVVAEGIRDSFALTGSNLTVTTNGRNAHGIYVNNFQGGEETSIHVYNSEFILNDATSALVYFGGVEKFNSVYLTNVTADFAGGNGNVMATAATGTGGSYLHIIESNLSGNIVASGSNTAGVMLYENSTLTGMSTQNGDGKVMVGIMDTATWNVTATSTVDTLYSLGTLGVTLTGTGYTDPLVTVDTMLMLDPASTIMLIFDGGFVPGAGEYSFQLFNDGALTGDHLSLIDWSNLDANWVISNKSFIDGVLKFEMEVIPEPGTWTLMLGGVGVLGYLQRVRRRSH